MEHNIKNGNSLFNIEFSTCKVFIKPKAPTTIRILNKLEPRILPIHRFEEPFKADKILTDNSGELVPNATIVSPIKKGLILKDLDILDVELTKKSAPKNSNKKPTIRNI